MAVKTKNPNQIDIDVGRRIRLQRNVLGMSQSTLAERLGITFQQVQKYEKGTNRVGASRLSNIAHILGVRVSFFFGDDQATTHVLVQVDELGHFLSTSEGQDLNHAFAKIRSPALRKKVLNLVKALADGTEPGDQEKSD